MGKEYTHRHGRKKPRKKGRSKKGRKKSGKKSAPAFRRRRRYASRPRRAPAQVLHERTTQAMMMELARQLLGPRYPGPNKITQQGPPFLPYDPWARQRRTVQRQEEQHLEQMTRIARERAQQQQQPDDGGPPPFLPADYGDG